MVERYYSHSSRITLENNAFARIAAPNYYIEDDGEEVRVSIPKYYDETYFPVKITRPRNAVWIETPNMKATFKQLQFLSLVANKGYKEIGNDLNLNINTIANQLNILRAQNEKIIDGKQIRPTNIDLIVEAEKYGLLFPLTLIGIKSEAMKLSKNKYENRNLTIRELEILQIVADRIKSDEKTKQSKISINTLKNHITSILKKMNVYSTSEAVIKGVETGLIQSPYSARELDLSVFDSLTNAEIALLETMISRINNNKTVVPDDKPYNTIKNHLNVIYSKLHARNRTQALLLFLEAEKRRFISE